MKLKNILMKLKKISSGHIFLIIILIMPILISFILYPPTSLKDIFIP